jgi:hypothetical protein
LGVYWRMAGGVLFLSYCSLFLLSSFFPRATSMSDWLIFHFNRFRRTRFCWYTLNEIMTLLTMTPNPIKDQYNMT